MHYRNQSRSTIVPNNIDINSTNNKDFYKMISQLKNEVNKKPTNNLNASCIKVKNLCGSCGSDKVCWFEPEQDIAPVEFCRDTSLHGLKYVGQPQRHLVERVFWSAAFLTSVIVATILINEVWVKYKTSPVLVSFQQVETTIFQIPFPAVTICNVNSVLRSFVENKRLEKHTQPRMTLKDLTLTNHVCTSAASFSQKAGFHATDSLVNTSLLTELKNEINRLKEESADSNADEDEEEEQAGEAASDFDTSSEKTNSASDVKEFLQKAAQSCNDMIKVCIWANKRVENCTKLFQAIETDFGECCTFNMVPQSLLNRKENDTRDRTGEILNWESEDIDIEALLFQGDVDSLRESYNNKSRPRRVRRAGKSYGLSLVLDPQLHEYFCTTSDSIGFQLAVHLPIEVPHVVDTGIPVQPNYETFIQITPDVTTAEEDVKYIDLEKRECYFNGEYELSFYKYYTSSNCFEECLANITREECGCVRYYMPRDNTTNLCGQENYECARRAFEEFVNASIGTSCTSSCRPTCTEIKYMSQVSVAPIRSDVEIWNPNNQRVPIPSWAHNNISIVHIYYGEDSTYPKIRKQLYGFTDLIANTGGLLGLCLGFSVLSLLEVFYFLTLRAWFKTRFKRQKLGKLFQKCNQLWIQVREKINDRQLNEDRIFQNTTNIKPKSTELGNKERDNSNFEQNSLDALEKKSYPDLIFGEVAPYYNTKRPDFSIY